MTVTLRQQNRERRAVTVAVAMAVAVAVAPHAACQSWRGAKLWRLDLKMNVLVAHAKQTICARHHDISGVCGGVRKMRRARFCFPAKVAAMADDANGR